MKVHAGTIIQSGFALLLVMALFPLMAVQSAEGQPNIVLIYADDLGWTGLGCFGSTFYETPNIDELADQGTRFTAAYSAASNCAPSRASIMSGQYTPRHGVLYVGHGAYQEKWQKKNGNLKRFQMLQPRGKTKLSEDIETMGTHLKTSGYRTAMFGKWHLGTKDQHPSQRGFDVAIASQGRHFGFKTDPQMDHPKDEYLSDFLSDHAAAFIKESAADEKPFFLYYADFLVHGPLETKENYLKHFSEKQPSKNHKSPVAAAMIKALDDSVGKIVAALDDSGVANNTLIVFTSDNGGLSYDEDGSRRDGNSSNLPLRGRKGSEYEGGIRIPWIVRWPGKTPAGVQCDVPVHQVDLFPTLAAVAGGKTPKQELHGVDLTDLFQAPDQGLTERNLYWYLPGYSGFHTPSVMVRRGKWKLIRRLESEEYLLFDTTSDIGETKNRVEDEPEIASSLNNAAMKWLDDLDAPRMTPNPEYNPQASRR
jgi:arylsulfatase A-like enzyme